MKENEKSLILPEFNRPPDAIAVDLDGTLFDSNTRISTRNWEALERCIKRGIPVVIATSRPARAVRRLCGEFFTKACSKILQNGAFGIAAPPLSGEFKESLTPNLARDIIDLILKIEPEMRITVEMEGYEFGTNNPREPEDLWEINSATPDMQLSLETALADTPTKIAAGGLARNISHVAEALTNKFKEYISVVPGDDKTFLNITN